MSLPIFPKGTKKLGLKIELVHHTFPSIGSARDLRRIALPIHGFDSHPYVSNKCKCGSFESIFNYTQLTLHRAFPSIRSVRGLSCIALPIPGNTDSFPTNVELWLQIRQALNRRSFELTPNSLTLWEKHYMK